MLLFENIFEIRMEFYFFDHLKSTSDTLLIRFDDGQDMQICHGYLYQTYSRDIFTVGTFYPGHTFIGFLSLGLVSVYISLKMSYMEVDIDDLEFHEHAGGGAYGSVYKAFWKSRERIVAVKKLLSVDENEVRNFKKNSR